MTLPPESYDPKALQDITAAVEAAKEIISDSENNSTEQELTLQGLSLQANETIQHQKLEKEATIEKLQSKINTLAAQVFSGVKDSPEKDDQMASFTRHFKIEPISLDSDEMVIYCYDTNGERSDSLNVSAQMITGRLDVPEELQITTLICGDNEIISINELPAGLTSMDCGRNQLTTLPELPDGLTIMNCGRNQLTTLPELPDGLTIMNCGRNQLTTLPDLPDGLTMLNCVKNQLTTLPELPDGLTWLYCGGNPFSDSTKTHVESRGFGWQ